MDVDGLPIIGPGVDYTQVGAIHQKRTLAFINHFISNTVSFLNKFSRTCELRFEKFDARIQKLEASLSILEAKLSSISGLENVVPSQETMQVEAPAVPALVLEAVDTSTSEVEDSKEVEVELQPKAEEPQSGPRATKDPRFVRFFRMIHVGVPVQAVRLKMQAEGLDPSILDTPEAVVPMTPTQKKEESADSNSESSFSD